MIACSTVMWHHMHVTQSLPRPCPGTLTLKGFDYNCTSLTLTCTTSGRPVHFIMWLKDGTVFSTVGDTEFRQEQTITNEVTTTYQHTLISGDIVSLVGSFTCTVGDTDGNSVSRTRRLNGSDSVEKPRAECVTYRCEPWYNWICCEQYCQCELLNRKGTERMKNLAELKIKMF